LESGLPSSSRRANACRHRAVVASASSARVRPAVRPPRHGCVGHGAGGGGQVILGWRRRSRGSLDPELGDARVAGLQAEGSRHRSGTGAPVDVGLHRVCRAEVSVRSANAKQHLRPPVIVDVRLRVLACITRRHGFDAAGGCRRRLAPGVPNRKVHDVEADIHDMKPVGSIMRAYRVEASPAGNCARVLVQHDIDAPLDGIARGRARRTSEGWCLR
jgi:hypothetical protein